MTDKLPDTWQLDNQGNVGLIGSCYACHTPADEWPESLDMWLVQMIAIETITDPSNQRLVQCTTDSHCPGHPVETHLFCTMCQKEGKHNDAKYAPHKHNRP